MKYQAYIVNGFNGYDGTPRLSGSNGLRKGRQKGAESFMSSPNFTGRVDYSDLICYDKIVVELKAVTALTDEHRAQVQNYLRATKMKLGLLVNFGHYPKVEYERIAL